MSELSIKGALKRAASFIDTDTARLDAELLLAEVLRENRTFLYTWPEKKLNDADEQAFFDLVSKREQGLPVAHLLKKKEFWSLELEVNSSTLIPRPDTEILVEQALLRLTPEKNTVLDLGTGTGAIALAIASENPLYCVIAADQSEKAVALAITNRDRLGLKNVSVLQSDWFSNITNKYHCIVSNPPYIDANDSHLNEGDVRFEPLSALVAEGGGLADLKALIQQASPFLHNEGYLLLEHGWQQAEFVRGCLCENGFDNIESVNDLGGNERVTLGRLKHG